MSETQLNLRVLPDRLAVCRLEACAAVPAWAMGVGLWSATRTADELSIVCAAERVPGDVWQQGAFRAMRVEGVLDFSLTGILAGLTRPLAAAGIAVFVLSTYDTDYILVREERLAEAQHALRGAGYGVGGA